MERNPYAPPESDVRDHQPPPEPGELASRWARLGGSLLDGLVLAVPSVPLMFLTGYWDRAMANTLTPLMMLGGAIVGFVLFCAVNGYLLATAGQTVGKHLVGTRIVRAADGRVPTLGVVLGLRYGSTYLFGAVPWVSTVYGLVDALFVFRADRRCVHDFIAGTKVVRAE